MTIPQIVPLSTTSPGCDIVSTVHGAMPRDWISMQQQLLTRLLEILQLWHVSDAEPYATLLTDFSAPPHTIQRLAELLDDPLAWYTRPDKFLRALLRVLSVTSTVSDYVLDKDTRQVAQADSSLVPIPWLIKEDDEDGDMQEEEEVGEEEEEEEGDAKAATKPVLHLNGSTHPASGVQQQHPVAPSAPATLAAGSAPMDAADYGPQPEDVKEAIANSQPEVALSPAGTTGSQR